MVIFNFREGYSKVEFPTLVTQFEGPGLMGSAAVVGRLSTAVSLSALESGV